MERQPSDSDVDMNSAVIRAQALEIFTKVGIFMQEKIAAEEEMLWKASESHHHISQVESEAVQQHLISSVIFRLVTRSDEDYWELEDIWDSVNVSRLDDIPRGENVEYHLNFENDIKSAMAENINIVLKRTIIDWSRQDGNVICAQIVWSGGFMECQRIVELIDQFNNNTRSIQIRTEDFSFHPQLRGQFISCHQTNPLVASIAAIDSSPKVTIDEGLAEASDNDEKGFFCAICHDMIMLGCSATQLPCKHLFHPTCIITWFIRKFNCPLCIATDVIYSSLSI